MAKRKRSRLSRKEGQRYFRQSLLFTMLTLILIFAIIFWGIPSLIKLAIFLSDIRSSTQPISGEDTIAPPPPIIEPPAQATNSASIRLSGFAEDGATVVLSIDGREAYETVADTKGEFLFDSVRLNSGENEIIARATDASGNQSQASPVLRVVYDTQAPDLSISTPQDGAAFYGSGEQIINVSGTADSDARVMINGSLVILSQNGNFSQKIVLEEGENIIEVVARDKAGNEAREEISVNFDN